MSVDLDSKNASNSVKIVGQDEANNVDVRKIGGVNRMATDAIVQVEELLGETVFPFTYIQIDTLGSTGDTLKTDIAAPSAVSVTTTQLAAHTSLNDFAKKHRDDLNADTNFKSLYKATTPRDSHLICIESLLIQTTRPVAGDVAITVVGTLGVTLGFDNIIDRPIALAIFPHPRDCRKGTINITGEIGVIETGRPPKRLLLVTSGGSPDMAINATGGDVFFTLLNNPEYDPTRDFVVTELRIETTANSFSVGSGKYIRVNELSNGHRVEIRSDGNLEYDENLKLLEDIHHAFVFGGGSKFDLLSSSGDGSLVAVFARPFFIRKAGTFDPIVDDDVKATIRDNLSSITRLRMSCVGFFED